MGGGIAMKKSTGIIIVALIESATLIINTCITSKISYNEGYKQAQADAQNETSILSQSVNEVDSQAQSSFESEISQLNKMSIVNINKYQKIVQSNKIMFIRKIVLMIIVLKILVVLIIVILTLPHPP